MTLPCLSACPDRRPTVCGRSRRRHLLPLDLDDLGFSLLGLPRFHWHVQRQRAREHAIRSFLEQVLDVPQRRTQFASDRQRITFDDNIYQRPQQSSACSATQGMRHVRGGGCLKRGQELGHRDDLDIVLGLHCRLQMRIVDQISVSRDEVVCPAGGGDLQRHVVLGITTQGNINGRSDYYRLSTEQGQESLCRTRAQVALQARAFQYLCQFIQQVGGDEQFQAVRSPQAIQRGRDRRARHHPYQQVGVNENPGHCKPGKGPREHSRS